MDLSGAAKPQAEGTAARDNRTCLFPGESTQTRNPHQRSSPSSPKLVRFFLQLRPCHSSSKRHVPATLSMGNGGAPPPWWRLGRGCLGESGRLPSRLPCEPPTKTGHWQAHTQLQCGSCVFKKASLILSFFNFSFSVVLDLNHSRLPVDSSLAPTPSASLCDTRFPPLHQSEESFVAQPTTSNLP